MKEGDIITTYYKGFFRLTRIVKRFYTSDRDIPSFMHGTVAIGDEYTPLFYFEKFADANGVPVKKPGKENCCDASYCQPAGQAVAKEIAEHQRSIINLQAFISTI